MSSQSIETVTAVITEKKASQPTLPAKFGKFIQFGYYFMKTFNQDAATSNATPLDEAKFIEILRLRATVDEQSAFVQGFFDQSKEIVKEIRKLVKVKPTKAKRVHKESTPHDGDEPAPKKKRGKKAVVTNGQSDLVAQIVALANGGGEPTVPPSPPSLVQVEVVDKPKKAAKVKEAAPAVAKEQTEGETVDTPAAKKGRKSKKETVVPSVPETVVPALIDSLPTLPVVKKEKKAKAAPPTPPTIHSEDLDNNDDDPLPVEPFIIDGVTYLIDHSSLDLYDFTTHDPIGRFDPSSSSLIPL